MGRYHLQNFMKSNKDKNPSLINSRQFNSVSSIPKYQKPASKFEEDKKNINTYGFSNIFPLIQKPIKPKQIISEKIQTKVHTIIPNPLQFPTERIMNPKDRINQILCIKRFNQYKLRIRSQKLQHSRKLDLMRNQYPHGILNYENPECQKRQFCETLQSEKILTTERKQRAKEFYNKHLASNLQSHLLSKIDIPEGRIRKTSPLAINNSKKQQINGIASKVNPALNFYNLNHRDYNIVTHSNNIIAKSEDKTIIN